MKRIVITVVSVVLVGILIFAALPVMAAKPDGKNGTKDVIAMSNGFPSGPHFNLNIHGKDPSTFTVPDPPYGGSIFVSEYSVVKETIQYESGKRASVEVLTVTDPVTQAFDTTPAVVQLPYEPQGFYVFARILGKPQNGKKDSNGGKSNIILKSNKLVDLQNFVEGDVGEVAIGLITKDSVYYAGDEVFYRFDEPAAKGKGKSKARDITNLFLYTGWVINPILDIYPPATDTTPAGDGVIDDDDVPSNAWNLASTFDDVGNGGNEDGIIQIDEWLAYNAALPTPLAWYFTQEWIFNIADLVITEQGLENDGTKLLQLRFYPVATTEFRAPGYIIVDKVTDPSGAPESFDFSVSDGTVTFDPFSLADTDLPKLLGPIPAGTYTVTEVLASLPQDWDLTFINIIDPTENSTENVADGTAIIDLDAGETVRIIFTNTYTEPVPG